MRPSNLIGEAILTLTAIIGFVYLVQAGSLTTFSDLHLYAAGLGLAAAFYAIMSLIHAIFLFMAGDGKFWWDGNQEKHLAFWEAQQKKEALKKKK